MNALRVAALLLTGIGIVTPHSAQIHRADSHSVWSPVLSLADQDPKKNPLPIQELDEAPVLIKQTAPAYPESALKDSLEGTVYLRVTVDDRGGVEEVVVEKGVRKDLEDAAIACMKQWKFKPAKVKGSAVRTSVVVPFRFKLTKGPVGPKTK